MVVKSHDYHLMLCVHVFSREERRWLEKQNKAERLLRKKEENARIRMLVGMSFWLDILSV